MSLIGIPAVVVEGHDACDKVQYVGDSEGPHLSLGDLVSLDRLAGCLPQECVLAHRLSMCQEEFVPLMDRVVLRGFQCCCRRC
jgi:hypothetical protein